MDTLQKNESIGIVSGAYFVGRNQILKWINDLAQLNYTKIEQTASGVFACHVFDALYPGQLKLEKVRFDARHEYDYVINYKVLQACFDRVGMKRQIDVEKLVKGKYQDNFEFMQWVKAYFDNHATEQAKEYSGLARRQEIKSRAASGAPSPQTSGSVRVRRAAVPSSTPTTGRGVASSKLYSGPKGAKTMMSVAGPQVTKLKEEVEQLKKEKVELQTATEDAVTEREFYFNKLRKVELICQDTTERIEQGQESIELLRSALEEIKTALYAEDDVAVDDGAPIDDQQYQEADGVYDEELQQDPQYLHHVDGDPRQPIA